MATDNKIASAPTSKPVAAKKVVATKAPSNRSTIDAVNERVTEAVEKKARSTRPFPACSFEEAAVFAKQLFEFGAGRPVRKITLFDHLGKSPDSGATRQIITNSGKYGLTKGSYAAEMLEITPEGAKAVDLEQPARERAKARIFLGLENVPTLRRSSIRTLATSCRQKRR